MAGFIILQDGRAYAGHGFGYDRTIEAIAAALPKAPDGNALAEWMLCQRVSVSGVGSVDLRELTPQNQRLLIAAIRDANATSKTRPPSGQGWDAVYLKSWSDRFDDLVAMIDSFERGEPPTAFNPHMRDAIPATGRKAGPGW